MHEDEPVIPGQRDQFAGLKALRAPAKRRTAEPLGPIGIAPEIPAGSEQLALLLGAEAKRNRYGEHMAVRRWFAESIGGEAPEQSLDAATLKLLLPDAPDEALDPCQWLFLDTETTGLAGGTGTYAFLVGIAWWDAGGLEVEQFFMREHSEEHSLLLALAERMAERRVLVTFNGKAFDWPLLETRFRMTRAIQPPAPRAHLDFLHPARNLWRLRLGSARLPELERHVLGWNRGADVMSELIPTIYFEFVRGGAPEPLVPIFHHNQMDLRGLAGVSSRVLALLAGKRAETDALETFGLSRICERRGETRRARRLYESALEKDLPAETERAARSRLARLAKREGDLALARELWDSLLGNSREGYEAYEQLAIHLEHEARDYEAALDVARRTLAELRRAQRLGCIAPAALRTTQARFERRLARLKRKSTAERDRSGPLSLCGTNEVRRTSIGRNLPRKSKLYCDATP
jgi:uncharacterized protein